MYKIFQLVYHEGNHKHVEWSTNIEYLKNKIKTWEEEGFGVGDDNINQITFTSMNELVYLLNELGA